MAIDVEHFDVQRADVDALALLGDALERVDDQPGDGFHGVLAGQVVQVEGALDVGDRGDAVDQAGAVVAAHDLFILAQVQDVAHHRADDVVERRHAHHQPVFVDHRAEAFVHLAKARERLRQVERVGQHQQILVVLLADVADHGGRRLRQDLLQDVLGGDEAEHGVDVVAADEVFGVRLADDLALDRFQRLIEGEVDDVIAHGHHGGDGSRLQLEHVLDHRQLILAQHAGLGAGAHHGGDVLGGDLLDTLRRHAQQLQDQVGRAVKHPDHRAQHAQAALHRPDDGQREALRVEHRQALGQQIGKQDEQPRHDDEAGQVGDAVGARLRQPVGQPPGQRARDLALADDAGQNGDRVHADLHDREEVARRVLELQDPRGAVVAVVGQRLQAGAARGGYGDFRGGEEGADQDQRDQNEHVHSVSVRAGGLPIGGPPAPGGGDCPRAGAGPSWWSLDRFVKPRHDDQTSKMVYAPVVGAKQQKWVCRIGAASAILGAALIWCTCVVSRGG
uniref:Uncharacterized protein n=1 Tax=Ralstonia solanacearum TaxID=305 RepID=A0A0S4TYG1_RALSL|nr:protein of unknown function [Ralstonia solanacearum]